MVGDNLDLNVARRTEQLLHEHSRVAKGLERLCTGTFELVRYLGRREHAPNAVSSTTRSCLDKQGIAQALTLPNRFFHTLNRTTAPQGDRNLRLFCQELGGDFVSQLSHHIAARTDENDTHFAAQVSKIGVLCDEAPPDPDGFGTRIGERFAQLSVIDIAALHLLRGCVKMMRKSEGDSFVRLAHEHSAAVGFGVECDRLQRRSELLVELAYGADEAHCRFAAIHNRYTLNFLLHIFPTY